MEDFIDRRTPGESYPSFEGKYEPGFTPPKRRNPPRQGEKNVDINRDPRYPKIPPWVLPQSARNTRFKSDRDYRRTRDIPCSIYEEEVPQVSRGRIASEPSWTGKQNPGHLLSKFKMGCYNWKSEEDVEDVVENAPGGRAILQKPSSRGYSSELHTPSPRQPKRQREVTGAATRKRLDSTLKALKKHYPLEAFDPDDYEYELDGKDLGPRPEAPHKADARIRNYWQHQSPDRKRTWARKCGIPNNDDAIADYSSLTVAQLKYDGRMMDSVINKLKWGIREMAARHKAATKCLKEISDRLKLTGQKIDKESLQPNYRMGHGENDKKYDDLEDLFRFYLHECNMYNPESAHEVLDELKNLRCQMKEAEEYCEPWFYDENPHLQGIIGYGQNYIRKLIETNREDNDSDSDEWENLEVHERVGGDVDWV